MNAWSHLPNAHHIDWIIESLKQNPELWRVTWNAAWYVAWEEAWEEATFSARVMARTDAWTAASVATWDAVYSLQGVSSTAARRAARSAVIALVAYDDCDQYLNIGYEKLLVYAELSQKPQAVLLLPIVSIMETMGTKTLENTAISI